MQKTKQFITDFLKESGAKEETLMQFNELYDQEIQDAMQQEAQGTLYQSREQVARGRQNIQELAAKHSLRKK